MKSFRLTLTLVMLIAASCSAPKSESESVDLRVEELLSQMTLEEKIGQMNQISTYGSADAMADEIRSGKIGSILNEVNPDVINQMQRIAIEESRLGIPILFARDVIHGFRTIFPIPLGLASTFDPELVEQGARVAAIETTATGVRWTFSPMLDVSRDARWGRIAESSGEDVLLNCVMGVALVRGYQGDIEGDNTSLAACAKHFVGYGASEGGRDYNSTNIPERQMRNVYLPSFKAAIDAGAMTLMTSFNDNDGVPATGNKALLTDLLRQEWGFDGMVVTDWNSAGEMIAHSFAEDGKDAARLSVNAGVDMDMMSHTYSGNLSELVAEGKVSQQRIDNAVRNILKLKFRLGLFDNPYGDKAKVDSVTYCEEHLEAAYRTALESAILLKNNGVLPLDKSSTKKILVAGPLADAPYEQLGTWAFDGEADHTITPLDALRTELKGKADVEFDNTLSFSRQKVSDRELMAFGKRAKRSDVILLFLGEEAILSGEAHCLADLNLRGSQRELLREAKKTGKPVVAVIIAGRPLTIKDDLKNMDALLYSFHPGTMGGKALCDLIFGKAAPSGKSPVTFPAMVGQIPIYYCHNMTGRPASGNEVLLDDIEIGAFQTSLGCTSYMLDAGFGPLFPFGYGLSYTTFEYSNLKTDKECYTPEQTIKVSFTLKNSGKRDGVEVAQLYVRDLVGSITRPVKELKDFKRIALKAGESREIEMELPVKNLAFYGLDLTYGVEPGEFELWVAGDSASGQKVKFSVK